MIALNQPQMWTIIGVLTAGLFAMLTLISNMFVRIIRTEIGGLRNEMNARFDAVNTKFDAVDTKFDAVNRRIEHLDRDIQFLMKRETGLE